MSAVRQPAGMFLRRASLLAACVVALGAPACAAAPQPAAATGSAFARLEQRANARVGVVALDTATGRVVAYRAGERFPFASTAKVLAAGVALRRLTEAQLDHVVRYDQTDVLDYAPVTDDFVTSGLAVRHLINASLQWSDNTAANLVVERLGGPDRLERSLRAIGDTTTSVDRLEPELNEAVPGDLRDTTTPRAMVTDLRRLLLGHTLTPRRRMLLRSMMVTNTTGDRLIRAGVPAGWTVADKTGSASYGTRNDVAVAWPPRGAAPVVIAVFTTHTDVSAKTDDALVAALTRTALARLSRTSSTRSGR